MFLRFKVMGILLLISLFFIFSFKIVLSSFIIGLEPKDVADIETTLNDSSTAKNVSFIENGNKTVWIRLPKDSIVKYGKIKLKGFRQASKRVKQIDSFDTSSFCSNPYTITTNGTDLWLLCLTTVYHLDLNGNVIDSFSTSSYSSNPTGITTVDGSILWILDADEKKVFKVNASTGENISYFSISQMSIPYDLTTVDGSEFWITDYWEDEVYHVDSNGNTIDTFDTASFGSTLPRGITTVDGSEFWIKDCCSKNMTYHVNSSGGLLFEINTSNFTLSSYGIATHNGEEFWMTDLDLEEVFHVSYLYPNNPYIDVGSDGDVEWRFYRKRITEKSIIAQESTSCSITNLLNGNDTDWDTYAYCTSGDTPPNSLKVLENYTYNSEWESEETYNISVRIKVNTTSGSSVKLYLWNYTANDWEIVIQESASGQPENFTVYNINRKHFIFEDKPLQLFVVVSAGLHSKYSYYESQVIWENREFNTTTTFENFDQEIEDFLSTCTPDANGNCDVPLVIHSDSAGKIEISDIEIKYGNWVELVENTLNDSSTSKKITFTGNENKTVWIRLPKEAKVIDAKLNLTGYPNGYSADKSTTKTVESTHDTGWYASIAIDSNDVVHIAYADLTDFDLRYCNNTGGTWSCTAVETGGDVGRYTSIAIDSNDVVHISHVNGTSDNLRYCNNTGGTWSCTAVDTSGNVDGYTTSIAIDSNDVVHIAYYDYTNDDLRYCNNTGGSWSCMAIETSGDVGHNPSIAIDSNDVVHIVHYDGTNDDLRYCNNTGGSWSCMAIETSGDVGHNPSIAIDSNDVVHIVHYDGTNDDLRYCNNTGGSWSCMAIETSGDVGHNPSIAIGPDDVVYIVHTDETNDDLRYCDNIRGTWSCTKLADTDSIYYGTPVSGRILALKKGVLATSNSFSSRISISWYNDTDLMYTMIPQSYPLNPYLDVSGDGDIEWSYSGEFNESVSPVQVVNVSEFQEYLDSCTPDENGYCDVLLVLHSDSAGKIEISEINVTYDYNVSSLFIITNIKPTMKKITNTSNTIPKDMSPLGFYLWNKTTGVYRCYVDGNVFNPESSGSYTYCPYSFTINQGDYFPILTVSYDPEIYDCTELNLTGAYYVLANDIVDSDRKVCFNVTADNITLDCKGHLVDGIHKSASYGIRIFNVSNIRVINCTFRDWENGIGLLTVDDPFSGLTGDVKNITLENNTIISCDKGVFLYGKYGTIENISSSNKVYDNLVGYELEYVKSTNNVNITDSIFDNTNYDYFLYDVTDKVYFKNTNFTAQRKIRMGTLSGEPPTRFYYSNSSEIFLITTQLSTNVDQTLRRVLINWTQEWIEWNETADSDTSFKYNLTNLLPNTYYGVFEDNYPSLILTSDTNGNLNFTLSLTTAWKNIKVKKVSFTTRDLKEPFSLIEVTERNTTIYKISSLLFNLIEVLERIYKGIKYIHQPINFTREKLYDFKDYVTNKAYYNAVQEKPPSSLVVSGETEFSQEAYQNISESDDKYFGTESLNYPYHRFNISIDESIEEIQEVLIEWEGHGKEGRTINLYVWNYSSNSWVLISSGSGSSDFVLNKTFVSDFSDIIKDGKIYVLVEDK